MEKFSSHKKYTTLVILLLIILIFLINFSLFSQQKIDFRSRAQNSGKIITVSGKTGDAIQQAVDMASDGDTIFIPKGVYTRTGETPTQVGWGTTGCFVDLKGKSLTLKGDGSPLGEFVGSVLFGEGHDKPEIYTHRAGICSVGGTITIDRLHIKEFEGRGLIFRGASVVIKNSLIDGNDQGGIVLTKGASLLLVNSFFVTNIGITTDNAASVKAYNNTFFSSKGFNADCNQPIPPLEFINNIVIDAELTIGAGWIYGDCPSTVAQFKNQRIVYNLLWKSNYPCYANHEYCDDFLGKISADPQLNEAAYDQRGWRGWGGNFAPKPGSPAIGAGDPSVPGKRDLGGYGGPCTDADSLMCLNFISANIPRRQPTAALSTLYTTQGVYPTEEWLWPTNPSMTIGPSATGLLPSRSQPPIQTIFLTPTSLPQSRILIENVSASKTFKINYLVLGGDLKIINQELGSKTNLGYDFSSRCSIDTSFSGGIFFSSSADDFQSQKFKNLTIECGKLEIVDLE